MSLIELAVPMVIRRIHCVLQTKSNCIVDTSFAVELGLSFESGHDPACWKRALARYGLKGVDVLAGPSSYQMTISKNGQTI